MNPLFFGTGVAPLYGVFHPPVRDAGRRTGVLLCPPLGQEYMRSHRALRQLAILLSREGFAVFRFDYRGSGDSAGDMESMTATTMAEDAAAALEELRDLAGVRKVIVVGLRAGVLPALALAGERAVASVVLWDPVTEGAAYVASLEDGGAGRERDTVWVMGFPYVRALRDSMRAFRVDGASAPKDVLAVTPAADATLLAFAAQSGEAVRIVETDEVSEWWKTDNEGSLIVPGKALRAIVEGLGAPAGAA